MMVVRLLKGERESECWNNKVTVRHTYTLFAYAHEF